MNAFPWCRLLLCAVWLTASASTHIASAQRVRFGSRDESAPAPATTASQDGWVSVASRYVSNSPSPNTSANRTNNSPRATSGSANQNQAEAPAARTPAYSTVETPVYVGSPVYVASAPPSSSAPPPVDPAAISYRTGSNTAPIVSPADSYAANLAPPVAVAGAWDPYHVASRHAAFAGTVVSNPGMPGQFTLPQPMPRVPYYAQQPVSTTAQPYVVIPDPGCSAPVATQVMPTAAPGVYPTTAPAFVPPTVPMMAAPPTVPALAPVLASPLGISRNCYLQADAIFFTRDARIGNTPLVLLNDNAATQSNVLLSTADIRFKYEPGPRILLGTEFDGFRAVEASYFGIYNWDYSTTITGNNNVNLPGDLGSGLLDFFNVDRVTVTYNSDIHNAELNYLHYYGNIAWLVGFRYFNLSEKLSINAFDGDSGVGYYNTSTYNNLFGGQLGGRIKQACGRWSYDLTGKAGIYDNVIRSSQIVSDFDGSSIVRNTSTSGNQVSFLGELGLNGSYKFSECLSLRGGYQVYWVEGLALAPRQLDFTDTATSGTSLNKTGGMFIHGAHAGLMAQW